MNPSFLLEYADTVSNKILNKKIRAKMHSSLVIINYKKMKQKFKPTNSARLPCFHAVCAVDLFGLTRKVFLIELRSRFSFSFGSQNMIKLH